MEPRKRVRGGLAPGESKGARRKAKRSQRKEFQMIDGRRENKKNLEVREPEGSDIVGTESCCDMEMEMEQFCQTGLVTGL